MHNKSRVAALGFSFVGALVNCVLALHVLSFWRVLRWEAESEWEGSMYGWRINSFKLVWALVFAYFTTACVVSLIGAVGIVRRTPSFVRLYRDYSLADIGACGLLTVSTAVASFRSTARATLCEELSGQPELLRDLAEAGLNPENCEQWFEHAVVGFVAITLILLIVRLQFVLTVTNYYKQLLRQHMYGSLDADCRSDVALNTVERSDTNNSLHQRIFLLPSRLSTKNVFGGYASGSGEESDGNGNGQTMLVYAPVPLDSLSESEARSLASNEAWISRAPSSGKGGPRTHVRSHSLHQQRNHHQRSHSRRHSGNLGRMGLPVLEEERLPLYRDEPERDRKA